MLRESLYNQAAIARNTHSVSVDDPGLSLRPLHPGRCHRRNVGQDAIDVRRHDRP